tara:strand:+ start:356 stop:706 length:351 start_codon:yes stop_codon:yes gene_type:complete
MVTPRLGLSSTDIHRRPLTSIADTPAAHQRNFPTTAHGVRSDVNLPPRYTHNANWQQKPDARCPALGYRPSQEASHTAIQPSSRWQTTDTKKEKTPILEIGVLSRDVSRETSRPWA